METMPSMQVWRRLHADGKLDPVQAQWFARSKPAEELYDTEVDPWNVRNLAADPQHAPIVERHRAALTAHLAEVGDLGAVSEWDLIKQGLVVDRLSIEYRSRVAPLPEPFDNLGGPRGVDGRSWTPADVPATTQS